MNRHLKGNLYKPQAGGPILLSKGLIFVSVEHFRSILKDFVMKFEFVYRFIQNKRKRSQLHAM